MGLSQFSYVGVAKSLSPRVLDYGTLRSFLRLGLRRGSWRMLSVEDRALYRCGLWVAKVRGRVVSMRLMVRLWGIILKLSARVRGFIYKAGSARALASYALYERMHVFNWAPEVKIWLGQTGFRLYLGATELFM